MRKAFFSLLKHNDLKNNDAASKKLTASCVADRAWGAGEGSSGRLPY
jgi:hypothetical protein